MNKRYAILAWRLIVGGMFLIAAMAKFCQGFDRHASETVYDAFARQSPAHHYVLISGEALLGLWVISGLFPRVALSLTVAVLLAFSSVLTLEIFSKHPRACGCVMRRIMPGEQPWRVRLDLGKSLIRNGILMAASAWLWMGARPKKGPVPAPPGSESARAGGLGGTGGSRA